MGINKKNTDVIVDADIVNAGRVSPLGVDGGNSLVYSESVGTWGLSNGYGIQYTNPNSFITVGDGVNSTGDYITTDLSGLLPSLVERLSQNEEGGTIFLGKGTYSLSSDVVISKSNIRLIGSGEGVTYLDTGLSPNASNITVYGPSAGVSVENVVVDSMTMAGDGKVVLGKYNVSSEGWSFYYTGDGSSSYLVENYLSAVDYFPLDSAYGVVTTTVPEKSLSFVGISPSYVGPQLRIEVPDTFPEEYVPESVGNSLTSSFLRSGTIHPSNTSGLFSNSYGTPPDSFTIVFRVYHNTTFDLFSGDSKNALFMSFRGTELNTSSNWPPSEGVFFKRKSLDSKVYLGIGSITSVLQKNEVYQIAVVFSLSRVESSNRIYNAALYKGTSSSVSLVGSTELTVNSLTLSFGDANEGTSNSVDFSIAQIGYFDRALSAQEITYLTQGPQSFSVGPGTSFPVKNLGKGVGIPFEEGAGTQDFSGASPVNNTEISYSVTPRVLLDVAVSSVSVGAAGGTDIGISEGPPRFGSVNVITGVSDPASVAYSDLSTVLFSLIYEGTDNGGALRLYPPKVVDGVPLYSLGRISATVLPSESTNNSQQVCGGVVEYSTLTTPPYLRLVPFTVTGSTIAYPFRLKVDLV